MFDQSTAKCCDKRTLSDMAKTRQALRIAVGSSRLMRLRYGALDPPLLFVGQPVRFPAFENTGHDTVAPRASEGENVV